MKTTIHHLEIIFALILRPGMFIGAISKENFINFLNGYIFGSESNFKWDFGDYIEKRHQIKRKRRGYIGQIEELNKNSNEEWLTTFSRECLLFIFSHLDKKNKISFEENIKKRIHYLLNQTEITENLIQHWNIVNLEANWFLIIFNEKEIRLIKKHAKFIENKKK